MEDLEGAPGSPALQSDEEPQGLNDPGDDLNPDMEEESRPNPPLAEPTADVDAFEDNEAPETVETMNDEEEDMAAGVDASDEDSELEELDETQFQDFDPAALNIPDKPTAVDESNVGLIGVHKRKRTEEEERERERKKKRKEGKREKPGRSRRKKRDGDGEEDFEGGEEMEGKRSRKSKVGADGRPVKTARRARTPVEENEEDLSPEERRRRALDRKMDEALKTHRPQRRRAGIDLEAAADAEIESMRQRMAKACEQDAEARARGQVATHKLAILPQVVELMNRNTIQAQLVDPDINILEAVRFMLEPADHDAALPNYAIQRELFAILARLPLQKEALIASGIGKIVLFYTKSIQPQPEIKRAAEKLIADWMRVVLKKNKTTTKSQVQTATYDPLQARASQMGTQRSNAEVVAERRRKALALAQPGNRARVEGGVGTYTIAPVSNLSGATGGMGRAPTAGEEVLRRIAQRGSAPSKR